MDLNKLMQIAIELAKEEHQQQKSPSAHYTAAFELLARSFIRCIPPMQRNSELNESLQEVANDSDFDNDNDKELFLEHMGHAKSLIIDMANKMEIPK